MKTTLVIALLVLFGSLVSCDNPAAASSASTEYKRYLYLTDSFNGHVYWYDPQTRKASTTSLLTLGGNGNGSLKFWKGKAYVANGSDFPGLYRFDPSASNPTAQRLVTGANVYDLAFWGASKIYYSVMTTWDNTSEGHGGISSLDTSQLPWSPVSISTIDAYMQDVVLGSDGYLYACKLNAGKVIRIDPTANPNGVAATFNSLESNPSGLATGTYQGTAGVFIASAGPWDSAGSIRFLAYTAASGDTPVSVNTAVINPTKVLQLPDGKLVVTGYSKTYLVSAAGAESEVTSTGVGTGGTSFGSSAIAYDKAAGLVYVPSYSGSSANRVNRLYVFDSNGQAQSYSPVNFSIAPTDGLVGCAFYQE